MKKNIDRNSSLGSSWSGWLQCCVATLSAILILNLNGVFSVIWGLEQVFSLVILGLCCVIIFNLIGCLSASLCSSGLYIVGFFVIYIISSGIIGVLSDRVDFLTLLLRIITLINSIIIVLTFGLIGRAVRGSKYQMKFSILIFVLFGGAVLSGYIGLLFPKWDQVFATTAADIGRVTGFFLNPNEYGAQAGFLLCFGALLSFTRGNGLWFILGFSLSLSAAFLSQSKAAVMIIVILGVFFIARIIYLGLFSVSKAKAGYFFIAIISIASIYGALFLVRSAGMGQLELDMTRSQEMRSSQLKDLIFEGKIDSTTTTGRTEAAEEGLQIWAESPIVGNGLTALDRMPKFGLGPHNSFIKILGEGGIVVFCAFLYALGRLGWDIIWVSNRSVSFCYLGCLLVLIAVLTASHTALERRNYNAMLGLLVGLSARNNVKVLHKKM